MNKQDERESVKALLDWLDARGLPDSGIRYEQRNPYGADERSRVELYGTDADFIAKHFHGQGARDLAAVLRSALASGKDWQTMTCDDQFALARLIASNIGYVLTPEPSIQDAEDKVDDLSALVPAPAQDVREGWVLVPREPTEAMIAAGVHAGVNATPEPWCPIAYRAMLAAAPALSPEVTAGEPVAWRYRVKVGVDLEWRDWTTVDVDPNDWTWPNHWTGFECQPLYTSPAQDSGGTRAEGLEEAATVAKLTGQEYEAKRDDAIGAPDGGNHEAALTHARQAQSCYEIEAAIRALAHSQPGSGK